MLWGAFTRALSEHRDPHWLKPSHEDYVEWGRWVADHLKTSAAFVADAEGGPLWPEYREDNALVYGGEDGFSEEEFIRRFIARHKGRRLDPRAFDPAEQSPHEVEFIPARQAEGEQTFLWFLLESDVLMGESAIKISTGTFLPLHELFGRMQIGGRGYDHLGRVTFEKTLPPPEEVKDTLTRTGRAKEDRVLLQHVRLLGEGVRFTGEVEHYEGISRRDTKKGRIEDFGPCLPPGAVIHDFGRTTVHWEGPGEPPYLEAGPSGGGSGA
jgi:hypothetical protein